MSYTFLVKTAAVYLLAMFTATFVASSSRAQQGGGGGGNPKPIPPQVTATIIVVDANGNPIPNITVRIALTDSDQIGVVAAIGITNANGQWQVGVNKGGIYDIFVNDPADPFYNNQYSSFTDEFVLNANGEIRIQLH